MNIIKYFNHGSFDLRYKCYIEIDDKKISMKLFYFIRKRIRNKIYKEKELFKGVSIIT